MLSSALGVEPLGADDKRRLLSRLLARLSHEIRNPLSSLVLTDVRMKGMSGDDLLREGRALSRDTQFILMTASARWT